MCGATGKVIKDTPHANGIDICIYTQDFENEFISLTDIARYKSEDPAAVIQNWMRNRDVIEFLGLWERLHNPDFKPLEFEGFRKQAGANAFTMSPKKWIEATAAIGIVSKAGRYGGTYAHSDIVMSFATWISPEFQLYIMKDYRRLKTDENSRLSLNWNLNREISKCPGFCCLCILPFILFFGCRGGIVPLFQGVEDFSHFFPNLMQIVFNCLFLFLQFRVILYLLFDKHQGKTHHQKQTGGPDAFQPPCQNQPAPQPSPQGE